MRASIRSSVPPPLRAKTPSRRRRAQQQEQRQRILRERVTYMLWVMANVAG